MEISSPPRIVALDTEVFDACNYSYGSRILQELISLVQKEKIEVILTSVTLHEVKSHIIEGVELTSSAASKICKEFDKILSVKKGNTRRIRISKNSDLLYEFKKNIKDITPSLEDLKKELLGKFDSFLEELDVEIIGIDRVSSEGVFERYFSNQPPFSSGEKKHEFPDAFALFTLQEEAVNRKKEIYVVSGDSDWESFCSSSQYLNWFKTLNELLETIIRETDPSKGVDACYKLYNQQEESIKEQISKSFQELNFSVDFFDSSLIAWDNQDVEVDVNSVSINNSSLIHIDDSDTDHPFVVFELSVDVNYKANVHYEDLEYATYDREDNCFFGGEMINTIFSESTKMAIEVSLSLSRGVDYSLCKAEIEEIVLDPNKTLGEIIIINTGFWENHY